MAEEIKMEILVVFQGHSCYTIAGNRKVFFVCFFSSSWIMAYLQLTCLWHCLLEDEIPENARQTWKTGGLNLKQNTGKSDKVTKEKMTCFHRAGCT